MTSVIEHIEGRTDLSQEEREKLLKKHFGQAVQHLCDYLVLKIKISKPTDVTEGLDSHWFQLMTKSGWHFGPFQCAQIITSANEAFFDVTHTGYTANSGDKFQVIAPPVFDKDNNVVVRGTVRPTTEA
jgi:hypothetical protein